MATLAVIYLVKKIKSSCKVLTVTLSGLIEVAIFGIYFRHCHYRYITVIWIEKA